MNIRPMLLSDYQKVYDLWSNTPGMGLNNLDDSLEGIAQYLARNPQTCFVAEENDEIVGIILSGHDGRRGFIYHLAVASGHRRRGIGSELVQAATNALSLLGINKVALVVFATNETGNAFWEKIGFTTREDLIYRNLTLHEMIRNNTK